MNLTILATWIDISHNIGLILSSGVASSLFLLLKSVVEKGEVKINNGLLVLKFRGTLLLNSPRNHLKVLFFFQIIITKQIN